MRLTTDVLGIMTLQCAPAEVDALAGALGDEIYGLGADERTLHDMDTTEDEMELLRLRLKRASATARPGELAGAEVTIKELRLLRWVLEDVIARLGPDDIETRLGVDAPTLSEIHARLDGLLLDRGRG